MGTSTQAGHPASVTVPQGFADGSPCTRLAIAPDEYLEWVLPKLSDLPVNRGKGHLATLTPMAYADMAAATS